MTLDVTRSVCCELEFSRQAGSTWYAKFSLLLSDQIYAYYNSACGRAHAFVMVVLTNIMFMLVLIS